MSIDTLDKNRLSADKQLSALDLDVTEAHLLLHDFQYLIVLLQGNE